jgi:hypothetical protein
VDIAVGVSGDGQAKTLLFELQRLGYRVLNVIEQTGTNRLATARSVPPSASARGVLVDLLFASSGD